MYTFDGPVQVGTEFSNINCLIHEIDRKLFVYYKSKYDDKFSIYKSYDNCVRFLICLHNNEKEEHVLKIHSKIITFKFEGHEKQISLDFDYHNFNELLMNALQSMGNIHKSFFCTIKKQGQVIHESLMLQGFDFDMFDSNHVYELHKTGSTQKYSNHPLIHLMFFNLMRNTKDVKTYFAWFCIYFDSSSINLNLILEFEKLSIQCTSNIDFVFDVWKECLDQIHNIQLYLNFINFFKKTNHTKLVSLCNEIISKYHEIMTRPQIMQIYGVIFNIEKDELIAQKLYQLSVEYYGAAHYSTQHQLYNLGTLCFIRQQYEEALQYYLRAVKCTSANKCSLANLTNTIGTTYYKMLKYHEALKYYKQALELYEGNEEYSKVVRQNIDVTNKHVQKLI